MALPGEQESTGFNWDQYTGGVTGQQSGGQQLDMDGHPIGIQQGQSLFDYTNQRRRDSGQSELTYEQYMQAHQPGGEYYNSGINGGRFTPDSGGATWGGAGGAGPIGQTGGGQSGAWDQNWFSQNIGTPRTPQELIALEDKIKAAGGEVMRNAAGVAGKIRTPDGRIVDIINSAGAGGNGFQWLTGDGGAPGAGGAGGLGGLTSGQFLAPWTKDFNAPTGEQALNSPGLQFAMQEAQKGLEKSAAARGTLLTGGTLKDLTAQQTGMALQGYGDVYNRALGEYGIQRDNFYANQDRPFGKLSSIAGLGQNAAAQTGAFGSGYGNNATGSLGDIGNANSAGSIAQGNTWSPYLNNIGQRR